MNVFSIKDVENLSGIQAHTLRIWEQRYSFIKPQRTETNIRHYSEQELRTILNVALLNRFGFRISKIDKMSSKEIEGKIQELTIPEAQHQKLIQQMVEQMVSLQLGAFEDLLTKILKEFGLKEGMMKLVFPFLERVGGLWAVGQIYPAQEHFIANIIRQKLLAYTDALPDNMDSQRSALLFLPEGEICELRILFAQYLLKTEGWHCMYLGANVPLDEVVLIAKEIEPELVFCCISAVQEGAWTTDLVEKVIAILPNAQIKLLGIGASATNSTLSNNAEILNSFEEVITITKGEHATSKSSILA
jgi:DNA-binding transcriptional MerR regulator